jgi:hypothetical protein
MQRKREICKASAPTLSGRDIGTPTKARAVSLVRAVALKSSAPSSPKCEYYFCYDHALAQFFVNTVKCPKGHPATRAK